MRKSIVNSIIKTICYSDLFDFPLTVSEIYQRLISDVEVSRSKVEETLKSISIASNNGYVCLKGREHIIQTRRIRNKNSIFKTLIARRVTGLLSKLPSILFIGISGSLAMKNCRDTDDIDLFIITKPKRLWITRLLVTIVLILLSKKRAKKTRIAKNKICTNLYISSDNLELPNKNLYSAYEIIQLKKMVNKDNTYERFIDSNLWVKKYLPNTKVISIAKQKEEVLNNTNKLREHIVNLIDQICYLSQKFYMRGNNKSMRVTKRVAHFYPEYRSSKILNNYSRKYSKLRKISPIESRTSGGIYSDRLGVVNLNFAG